MGRKLHRVNSGAPFDQEYHPGCLWSILHILDHHHRNTTKTILPRKTPNGRRRHAKCCANPKTTSMDRDNVQALGLLDAEADKCLVEQHLTELGPIDKSIKALVSEERSEEEKHNHWVLGFSEEPKFQKGNSIQHLEPSDYRLGTISTDHWANPIIILHKKANTSANELQFSSLKKANKRLVSRSKEFDVCDTANVEGSFGQNQHSGNRSGFKPDKVMETSKSLNQMDVYQQVKECVDALEIFKVNKELFLNILQDPEAAVSKQFPGLRISDRKAKLTKSGSFPVADISRIRYLRPSKLEHKQNETWICPKGEKFVPSIQVSKADAVKYLNDCIEKTRPSLADEDIDNTTKNEVDSSLTSNRQTWNRLVIGRLRHIKQRIKHIIKERKRGRGKSNSDGLLQRVATTSTPSVDGEYLGQDGSESSRSCNVTDGFDHNHNNSELHRVRRTASLNESMDKYAQLFKSSSKREVKLPHSKSLRLRNEDNVSSKDSAPKFFRRISSLSDVESFYSLVKEVVRDSEKAVVAEVDCSTNIVSYSVDTDNSQLQDAVIETECQNNMNEQNSVYSNMGLHITYEPDENTVEPAKFASFLQEDQKADTKIEPEIVEACSESEPMREGNNEKSFDLLQFELDSNEACFSYVRDVLELSGFTGNDSLGNWYSLDQPLDPSLFKEMETELHHYQVNDSEVLSSTCGHQLLFDLINKVVVEMYEASFTYFPRPFSFNHRIRPMPKGDRVIEEAWSRICWYLSFRSEVDRSLDEIVAQDLTKGDGWMNHQFETECVALELEDLIFDDLLQEVICSSVHDREIALPLYI